MSSLVVIADEGKGGQALWRRDSFLLHPDAQDGKEKEKKKRSTAPSMEKKRFFLPPPPEGEE